MKKYFLLIILSFAFTSVLSQCRDTVASFILEPADPLCNINVFVPTPGNTTFDCVGDFTYAGQYSGSFFTRFSSTNQPIISKEYQHNLYSIAFRNSFAAF